MKVYFCNFKEYTIFVLVNGRIQTIKFTKDNSGCSKAMFMTENAELQKAIEHHIDFGKIIFLQNQEKAPVETKEETKRQYAATYPKVTTIQGACRILVEKYNIPEETINSKADVLNAANELNISFPKL